MSSLSIFKVVAIISVLISCVISTGTPSVIPLIIVAAWLAEASTTSDNLTWDQWLRGLSRPTTIPFYVLLLAGVLRLQPATNVAMNKSAAMGKSSGQCGYGAEAGSACGCGSPSPAKAVVAPVTVKPTAAMNRTLTPPTALPKPRLATPAPKVPASAAPTGAIKPVPSTTNVKP